MTLDEVLETVKKIGISLIGQTEDLTPADKKIYGLRDSIACVREHATYSIKYYV